MSAKAVVGGNHFTSTIDQSRVYRNKSEDRKYYGVPAIREHGVTGWYQIEESAERVMVMFDGMEGRFMYPQEFTDKQMLRAKENAKRKPYSRPSGVPYRLLRPSYRVSPCSAQPGAPVVVGRQG